MLQFLRNLYVHETNLEINTMKLFSLLLFLSAGSLYADGCLNLIVETRLDNTGSFYLDSTYNQENVNSSQTKRYWTGTRLDSLVSDNMDGDPLSVLPFYAEVTEVSGLAGWFSFAESADSTLNVYHYYENGTLSYTDSVIVYGDTMSRRRYWEHNDDEIYPRYETYGIRNDTLFYRDSSSTFLDSGYYVAASDGACLKYDSEDIVSDTIKIIGRTDGFILRDIEPQPSTSYSYIYDSIYKYAGTNALNKNRAHVNWHPSSEKYFDLLGRRIR